MADGAYRWQGNWPAPDAARVAEIDAGWDEAGVGAFAEPVRAAAVERIERALAAARTGDLTEAAAELTHARSVLDGLDPAALEPRRGLAGLFDSRRARLKRFRDAWARAAAGLTGTATELVGRVEAAGRRSGALDGVWTEIRDALADLDAHLAAAAGRLTGHAPAEGEAPHPLLARRATLDACRAAALQALPLIRSAQNADARASEALKACADGVTAWREDWKEALGLSGKRPKSIRPDRDRLARTRDDLRARIDRALAELTASRGRRAEVESRMAELRRPL
ncbi:MAG: toxic anion resistance protein [Alphaproteobacteria bacterium]|nr:toxic anion resistance protein [Alphaproteobacteria bacterium]